MGEEILLNPANLWSVLKSYSELQCTTTVGAGSDNN